MVNAARAAESTGIVATIDRVTAEEEVCQDDDVHAGDEECQSLVAMADVPLLYG